jgi:calcium-dependent protein kinase
MLVGYPPFTGNSDIEIVNKVKEGRLLMPSKEWSRVSEEAKDLVSKMLTRDPRSRITADTAFEHPWF